MMKKCIVFLGLFAAACSSGAPSTEQQRIAALEQEKAQLEGQLKEARSNIAKLQAVIGRGGSAGDGGGQEPSGPVVPQSVNPQPDNNVGGQPPAGQSGGSSGGLSRAPQGIE